MQEVSDKRNWPDLVEYFDPSIDSALKDPKGVLMDVDLMIALDKARKEMGSEFIVTNGYSSRNYPSPHPIGQGVDGYFNNVPSLYSFIHMLKYSEFLGVGLYPHTEHGIIHVDNYKDRFKRSKDVKLIWIRNRFGDYLYAPSEAFKAELLIVSKMTWSGDL